MANLYAVLIGINGYKQCRPLEGCINDVLAVGHFFEALCAAQDDLHWKPSYLLEPASGTERLQLEADGHKIVSPVRQHIIDAFRHFDQAEDGDFCLLYYSGHGSTVTAPEVLKGYEPGDVLQTIVCADSRINGSPDLLDKELGYLIAKAVDGKAPNPEQHKTGVHFLAIFDSCHAGTITRSTEDNILVARMAESGPAASILEGFTTTGNCYYEPFEPGQLRVKQGGIRHARHINISAARNTESAIETYFPAPDGQRQRRGVFTWSLLETLRQNTTYLTYAELIRRVTLAVRTRVDNQIPVLGTTNYQDDNLMFFRNQVKPVPAKVFLTAFDERTGKWILNAGSLNGIPNPATAGDVFVKLGDRDIKVISTEPAQAVLDPTAFTDADKSQKTHIITLDFNKIKVGLSKSLTAGQQQAIKTAFEKNQPMYAALTAEGDVAQYLIQTLPDRSSGEPCFVLTRPGSNIPLFMRTPSVDTFVSDVGKVCRHEHVLNLNNPGSEIPIDAVAVTISTIEGVPFDQYSFEALSKDDSKFQLVAPQSATIPYPETVRVSGKMVDGQIQQPAIKVRIEVKEGSKYWVGALYCDEKLGISAEYLPVTRIGVGENASYMEMSLAQGKYMALPLEIDEHWFNLGVTEIQDYLVLFVSTQPFDLSQYEQEGVALDITRSINFSNNKAFRREDWKTIKIPIQVAIPKAKQTLSNGQKNDFGAFTIQAPANFKGTCEAVTRSSVMKGKSADGWAAILPPYNLWNGLEGTPETFARGVSTLPDTHLSILELLVASGKIDQDNPLMLHPSDTLSAEEVIVPFGLDKTSGQWISLGYTDDDGHVCIVQLPGETDHRIGQQQPDTEAPGGSVKVFFQKLYKTNKPPPSAGFAVNS